MRELHWRAGLRRAVVFILIYAAILYIANVVGPESFRMTAQELPLTVANAAVFFMIFTVLFAWTEKRRAERTQQLRSKKSDQKSGKGGSQGGDEQPSESSLKGRPNPNTSRKKARRRR